MHTESLNRWYLDLQSQKVPALPGLTFLWEEMEVYKMPAGLSTLSVKSIYQAAPDSGGIHSSHFWLSSSYGQRWADAQRGRGDWELGAQCCEHKVNLNLQECPLQLRPEALGGQGNGKQSMIGFCYMETDLKSSMQREHYYVMKQEKNMYLGCSGKGREGWKTLLFQPVLSLVWKALPSDVQDCPLCSLRCVLALPKTACLTLASSLSSSFAHVMGWMEAPEKYGYILISGSYECDLFWKKNFCRCS